MTSTSPRPCIPALLASVTLVLLAACGPTPGPDVEAGQGPTPAPVPGTTTLPAEGEAGAPDAAPTPTDGAAPSEPAGQGEQPPPAGGGEGSQTGGGQPVDPPPADPEPADQQAPGPPSVADPMGALCRPYLQPTVPSLLIEVDAQAGAELPQAVIDHLVATLAGVLDKPGGIAVDTSGTIEGGAQPWTLDSVRAAAAASRTVDSTPEQLVVHVLSLRGEPAGDSTIEQSIGVAFAAGELAVFPDRIDGLATLIGGSTAVLRAVVVHEAGHLLCLINLGYTSEIPHEDPQHPGHSVDQGSVMFHAIETTAVGQLFTGPPPDTFTDDDRADLDGLRTGRY